MKKYYRIVILAFVGLIILWIYKQWFFIPNLIGGDANYLFKSMYSNYPLSPYGWTWAGHSGLGGSSMPFLSNEILTKLPIVIFGQKLGFEYGLVEKIGMFMPFLLLAVSSPWILFSGLFPKRSTGFLSSLLFSTNTYILMLVGGGLVYLGITYALLPILILVFIRLLQNRSESLKLSIIFGFLYTIIVLIDLRYAYIGFYAIFLYGLLHVLLHGHKDFVSLASAKKALVSFGIPLVLSAHWLIPLAIGGKNPLSDLGDNYTTISSVVFFSFAKFEDTLSLIHPNWPENIFGKTSFFRPEFLVLPLLAFSALLIKIKSKQERVYVIYLSLLALIGAFLAKGANDPFGGIYLWMFDHIPGMVLFRDPTKWYTLTAISFSILISLTIDAIIRWFGNIKNGAFRRLGKPGVVLALIIIYAALILPALKQELPGTFVSKPVPDEYKKLESFIDSDPRFSRTLWLPHIQRFGYSSSTHPGVSAQDLFNVLGDKELLAKLSDEDSLLSLQEAGVRYVILPLDSQKEIFVSDRKYDETIYDEYLASVRKIPWLREVNTFGKIQVFELPFTRDHVWSSDALIRSYKRISPVRYTVELADQATKSTLIFSESYNSGWIVIFDGGQSNSIPYKNRFNSFVIPPHVKNLTIYFDSQKWVDKGVILTIIGGAIFTGIIILMGFFQKKSPQKKNS